MYTTLYLEGLSVDEVDGSLKFVELPHLECSHSIIVHCECCKGCFFDGSVGSPKYWKNIVNDAGDSFNADVFQLNHGSAKSFGMVFRSMGDVCDTTYWGQHQIMNFMAKHGKAVLKSSWSEVNFLVYDAMSHEYFVASIFRDRYGRLCVDKKSFDSQVKNGGIGIETFFVVPSC